MVNVSRVTDPQCNGRTVAIDWTPPAGPYVVLTAAEWRALRRWIETHADPC